MDKANLFERNRQKIINTASARLDGASDSRAFEMIARYCRKRGIPATDAALHDAAREAVRRKLVAKIKQLQSQLIALNEKVNSFHP